VSPFSFLGPHPLKNSSGVRESLRFGPDPGYSRRPAPQLAQAAGWFRCPALISRRVPQSGDSSFPPIGSRPRGARSGVPIVHQWSCRICQTLKNISILAEHFKFAKFRRNLLIVGAADYPPSQRIAKMVHRTQSLALHPLRILA